MQKIIVLNPKGGSGKTTVATNLASYFAVQGLNPVLMDMDAQGSSTRWLSKRTMEHQQIHGIATYEQNSRVTRSFALRIPQHCQRVVVDTPAALDKQLMPEVTHGAHAILVPVLPSDIDIHAAAKCITNLLLVAKIPRESQRIGVIANRVKKNTVMYRSLMRFLESLEIPILTTLRDSQSYLRASESGVGLFEMKPHQVRDDLEQWLPLLGWLGQREGANLNQPLDPTPAIRNEHSSLNQNLGTQKSTPHAARNQNRPPQPTFKPSYPAYMAPRVAARIPIAEPISETKTEGETNTQSRTPSPLSSITNFIKRKF